MSLLYVFQILDFVVNNGEKKQKMAWNNKKLCLQALYIWVSIHHMIMLFYCTSLKWWHSRCFFHFFKILLLWFARKTERVKKAKNGPKWQKILPHFVSQELYLIWLWFLVLMCKMMISPANFFIFLKVWFFRFFKIHQ